MALRSPQRAATSTSGASDLASLEAGGADVLALGRAADQGANALNVGIPATLRASVRMRDVVPEAGALTADIAGGSHDALHFLGVAPARGGYLRRVTDGGAGDPIGPDRGGVMDHGWHMLRSWVHHCSAALAAARAEIDALNVFPVPDGDTGTNVWLTWEAARAEVDARCAQGGSLFEVAHGLARGALMGARGNSGVILSQILRGVSDGVREGQGELGGHDLSAMLRRGQTLAYAAVAQPVEGTMLTVVRAAADAAEAAAKTQGDVVSTAQAAARAAHDALARTPELLPVLRDAGVVDAGGRSLTVVLDALVAALLGTPFEEQVLASDPTPASHPPSLDYRGPAYEVMYLLDATTEQVAVLRRTLQELGDSLVVIGDEALWNVHVHVDDPGAAIEAGIAAGRPHHIRISHLRVVEHPIAAQQRALIAVTHGPGTAALLADLGAACVPVIEKERPSTSMIIDAINRSGAHEVIMLPSDADIQGVCELAAEQARQQGLRAFVIPTRSIVQTLAAAAVHDADQRLEDDVVAMTRAAGATRYAAITTASRAALTTAGPCEPGDTLGLLEGDIACVCADWSTATHQVMRSMLAGGAELITLVFGSQADAQFRADIEAWAIAQAPFADVVAYDGGQPLWPVIIGVE